MSPGDSAPCTGKSKDAAGVVIIFVGSATGNVRSTCCPSHPGPRATGTGKTQELELELQVELEQLEDHWHDASGSWQVPRPRLQLLFRDGNGSPLGRARGADYLGTSSASLEFAKKK